MLVLIQVIFRMTVWKNYAFCMSRLYFLVFSIFAKGCGWITLHYAYGRYAYAYKFEISSVPCKLITTFWLNSFTSPSADMVRLGVKVQVQSSSSSRTQFFFQKILELAPLRCVPSFKSLAQVWAKHPSSSHIIKYRYKFKLKHFFFKNACMDPPRCVPSLESLAQV